MVVFHKKLNMKKRVVITGIGCISSLGNSIKEMEINLTKGTPDTLTYLLTGFQLNIDFIGIILVF